MISSNWYKANEAGGPATFEQYVDLMNVESIEYNDFSKEINFVKISGQILTAFSVDQAEYDAKKVEVTLLMGL